MFYHIALGSNLGDLNHQLHTAIDHIARRIGPVIARSSYLCNEAEGFQSEHLFFNAVIIVESKYSPLEVLHRTQAIERDMGRIEKTSEGVYSDRPIDIDLLATDTHTRYHSPELTLPHPRLAFRRFVLQPWAEIAPDFRLPDGNCVADHLAALTLPPTHRYHPLAADLLRFQQLLHQLDPAAPLLTLPQFLALNEHPSIHIYATSTPEQPLAGIATLALTPLLTGTKAWVEDLVVDSTYRGLGHGKSLLQRLEREARRANAHTLNLTSRPSRIAANEMYKREGYQLRNTNIYIKHLEKESE